MMNLKDAYNQMKLLPHDLKEAYQNQLVGPFINYYIIKPLKIAGYAGVIGLSILGFRGCYNESVAYIEIEEQQQRQGKLEEIVGDRK